MFRKLSLSTLIALALVAILATNALALVTFDPSTGTGFVGKGDVQTAFGWNNAQLQANAAGVSFSLISTETKVGVCEWITGEGTRGEQTHQVNHTTIAQVNDVIAYDARTHKQIDGFYLTGFGAVSETYSGYDNPNYPMVLGEPCPGNPGNEGVWISVETTGSNGGGLYVNFGSLSVLIWP